MKTAKSSFVKFLYAMVMGIVISAFSFGVSTTGSSNAGVSIVHAQEAQENAAAADENADADDNSKVMLILLGGMLIIILAVVITVVASFVTTAPIVDEI